MILINLLPQELRPIKRTPLPYIVTIGGLIAAVAVMGLTFFASIATLSSLNAEKAKNEDELKALKPVIDEHNDLAHKKENLKDKIDTIQEILSDRKIWSEHLHKLASLTPDNIWYSRIRVYAKPDKQTVQKLDPETKKPIIDPKTNQPQTEVRNIRVPILEVSGYVIPDQQTGIANAAPLSEATSQDPEFSKHFAFDNVSKIEYTDFKGFSVRSFTLQYKIQVDNTVEAGQ